MSLSVNVEYAANEVKLMAARVLEAARGDERVRGVTESVAKHVLASLIISAIFIGPIEIPAAILSGVAFYAANNLAEKFAEGSQDRGLSKSVCSIVVFSVFSRTIGSFTGIVPVSVFSGYIFEVVGDKALSALKQYGWL